MRSAEEVKAAILREAEQIGENNDPKYTYRVNGEVVAEIPNCFADHVEMLEELAALIDDDFREGGDYDGEVDCGRVDWDGNTLTIIAVE